MIPICILAIEDDDDRIFMTGLAETYGRLVYHTIRKVTSNNWDIDEIYQITWETLVTKTKLLRGLARNQQVNYLITTAHNKALNYVRDRERLRESAYDDALDASDYKDTSSLAELHLIKSEDLVSLAHIWPKLDKRNRYILEGYYILEKPMEELAGGLGIKTASVRMALTRARKAAYKLLSQELETQRRESK